MAYGLTLVSVLINLILIRNLIVELEMCVIIKIIFNLPHGVKVKTVRKRRIYLSYFRMNYFFLESRASKLITDLEKLKKIKCKEIDSINEDLNQLYQIQTDIEDIFQEEINDSSWARFRIIITRSFYVLYNYVLNRIKVSYNLYSTWCIQKRK